MAHIRNVNEPLTKTPPKGSIVLGLARHLSAGDPRTDPDGRRFHTDRARLFHDFVDEHGVAVSDWGTLDSEDTIREVEEVIIEIAKVLVPALAQVVVAWIGQKSRKPDDTPRLLGVAIKAPSGAQVEFQVSDGKAPSEIAEAVEAFLMAAS